MYYSASWITCSPKNPDLQAYIKWDCNSLMYNAHSAYEEKIRVTFMVDYVKGLYHVLDRLRAKYPKVPGVVD